MWVDWRQKVISSDRYPEWLPLRRFSIFELGSDISDHFGGGESEATVKFVGTDDDVSGLCDEYRSDALSCRVYTVANVIDQVSPERVCLYQGINMIGSQLGAILDLLDHPAIEWRSLSSFEKFGEARDLGLVLSVEPATNTIHGVTLRPAPAEYFARQQQVERAMSGVDIFDTIGRRWKPKG
jgi:hypothetical protein